MLLNQIEEMNQRLSHRRQNHSEVQEQLSDANNKLSQACLVSFLSLIQDNLILHHENLQLKMTFNSSQEKAMLSTQVLKLEDNIKQLKAKLTEPLSDKDPQIQVSYIIFNYNV